MRLEIIWDGDSTNNNNSNNTDVVQIYKQYCFDWIGASLHLFHSLSLADAIMMQSVLTIIAIHSHRQICSIASVYVMTHFAHSFIFRRTNMGIT